MGVVVYGAKREVPVLEVEQGTRCVGYGLRPAAGCKDEEGRNGGTRNNYCGYRQQTLENVQPVAQEVEELAFVDLTHEGERE